MTDISASRILAAAAALFLAAPAVAAPSGSPEQAERAFRVAIPIADLDLASDSGRKALIKRSRILAQRTCAPDPYPSAYDADTFEQCRDAFARAAEAAIARSSGAAEQGTR